ncbi:MAG: 4Fe-4S binding protein [Candidatus Margulisiibacteriota bacterium]
MANKPGFMLWELLRSLFKKPATELYPYVRTPPIHKIRGRLIFYPAKCIGCKICMRDCPSGAIEIKKISEKQFEADIDLSKCIYCAQCVESCPKQALAASEDFELAALNRKKLIDVTIGEAPVAAPQNTNPPQATNPPAA